MKILFELEDRIRPDSTCVYFCKAFQKLADVTIARPEQLPYIDPKYFDLYVRVDYGIDYPAYGKVDPWRPEFKNSVYYVIDTHIDDEWRLKMAKEKRFKHVFCAQMPALKADWHTKNVYWLPLACDPDYHKPKQKYDKIHDICFIGSVQPHWQSRRIERLDKLFKSVPNFWTGNKFFEEATIKYAQSKIVFNSAHSNDINMRVFEAMCSGTCLLTDKQDWQGLFEDDRYFFDYKSDEEMVDKANRLLKNEKFRTEMEIKAQNLVLSKHTYLHRCKEILKTIGM